MVKVSKDEVLGVLRRSNPTAREQSVQLYAQAFLEYVEAVENIERNGTICAHPRTAQPIENPFCRVKAAAMSAMNKMIRQLDSDPLWKWWEIQNAPELDGEDDA